MTTGTGVRAPVHPVDERLPLRRLAPLSVQHVLAMIATPVSTTFLTGQAVGLSAGRTASLLGATLILCGAGALLQSFGVLGVGARLPFVMLPGGAAAALFLQIARAHGPATASGSAVLAAALLLAVLPLYRRIVRLFPPLVLGTTVLLIGVSMIRVAAQLITGAGSGAQAGVRPSPSAVVLAGVTVACTVLCFLLLRGPWRQSAVLIGMAASTVIAVASGLGAFAPADGRGAALPIPFPFGVPRFDVLAALPLLVFALSSLAEATGQTVLNSEAVGRDPDAARDVPRVVRADAAVSLVGGAFGTSLLVTSSENIGIVQLTGVRSRFVTAGAGLLLIVTGLLAPVSRLLAGIPQPVVGGSALVIYSAISVMGIRMLQRADLAGRAESTIAALALATGLLPVVVPTLYAGFPGWVQTVLGSGVVAGTLTGVVLHALFQRFRTGHGASSSV